MSTRVTRTERFLVFGHRGSPRRFPENSVPSFEEALRAGADGFETDIRLLSDRTAVLFHDDELRDTEVETLSLADITGRGIDLASLNALASFAGRTTMILEVKRNQWPDVFLSEVVGWPGVIVASFDHELIADLARRNVSFDLGLTTFGRSVGFATYAAQLGVRWTFPSFRYVDERLVRELHAVGIKVVPWTPNRERDWQRLRDAGCDGVITDLPEEAVRWRGGSQQLSVGGQ